MNLPHRLGSLCVLTVCAVTASSALSGCGKTSDRALAKLAKANQSFTPQDFVKAAGQGDIELLGLFFQAGMDRNAQDGRGYTALMQAAESGQKTVVKALLQEGAKTEFASTDPATQGSTALLLAAGNDHADCVRALIDANADVNAKTAKNWTPLTMAVYRGHLKTTEVFLKTSRDALQRSEQLTRGLMVAALLGHHDIAKALLDAGAPLNKSIEKKQTALMFAAMAGKKDLTQLLLSRGSDATLVNADGSTASILAMQKGFPEVAKMIDTYVANAPAPSSRTEALAAAPQPVAPNGQPVPKPASPVVPATGTPPMLAANPTLKSAVPAPQPAPDPAATAQQEVAGARMEQAWLKEKKVDPQALLTVDTGQDSDGDGWTDAEEIAYGTNPNDPGSHPPLYTKLRMVKLEAQPFPVLFEGVEGKKAAISIQHGQLSERYVLAVGGKVPGETWKVSAIRPRQNVDKSGTTVDVSELLLINPESGEKLVLVKSMQANSPGGSAVLSLEGMDREIQVKEKQQFALGTDDKDRYTVLDIRPTQVVLKVNGTGEVITVTMRDAERSGRR